MTETSGVTRWLARPVDAAGLGAFRIAFGALLLVAVVRSAWKGTIHAAFVEPRTFFPLVPGLGPLPYPGMHVVFALLALAAIAITAGWRTRPAAALFALLFCYAHFADLTNYLNHYYLVALLVGLMAVLPVSRAFAADGRGAGHVPHACYVLLRFQVTCVYVFAGLAKLRGDWLREGLPLRIWLPGSADVPLIGGWLVHPETALVMSWLGAAFDLFIPFLLSARPTRPFAYAAVVVFHAATAALFRLGMFPLFMMAASLIFLPPGWPRRRIAPPAPAPAPLPRATLCALGLYALVQLALPLRHHLHADDPRWSERGYRFAWHVMLMEKNGVADFTLRDRRTGAERPVRLADWLTPLQIKMMSTQPDLIRAFARILAADARRAGHEVAVHADVLVSLNGRPPRRLIDPAADLAAEALPPGWILPAP